MNRLLGRGRLLLFLFVGGALGLADSPTLGGIPDLEFNPMTGDLESVDVAEELGSVVRHVIDKGPGKSRVVTQLSPEAGLEPRIAITPAGVTWAVWWREGDTDQVFYRRRTPASTTWSTQALVSSVAEDSRSPEVVHVGAATWIVYEVVRPASRSVAVTGIIDTPEPFPQRAILATTTGDADLDVLAHTEAGRAWITWIDGADRVGWSRYDEGLGEWTDPEYEPCSADGVEEARSRVRAVVVGP